MLQGMTRWIAMAASQPSTSANLTERQNPRRRQPLNNEALGFYACLTSVTSSGNSRFRREDSILIFPSLHQSTYNLFTKSLQSA